MGRLLEFWLHPERFIHIEELTDYCMDRHQELQQDYRSVQPDGDFDQKIQKLDELATIEGKQAALLEVGRQFHPDMDEGQDSGG